MRVNDKDIKNEEYFLIHVPKQFQKNLQPKSKNKNSPLGTSINDKNEINYKDILLYEDIIKFDYIFHIALEREMLQMITKEVALKSQEKFITYIKERTLDEKLNCINRMNKLISSIHLQDIEDLAVVKKYLILYYFSNKLNKKIIEAKLRKLHVKLKHY
jgi:hypothetical protein